MNEIRTLNGKFDARCRRCLKAGPIQRSSRRNGNPSAGLGQHNNQRKARLVYATPVGFVIFDSLLGTEALLPDEQHGGGGLGNIISQRRPSNKRPGAL
jgi:hypothetical protein